MAELYLIIKQTTLALQYDQEILNPQTTVDSFVEDKDGRRSNVPGRGES